VHFLRQKAESWYDFCSVFCEEMIAGGDNPKSAQP
jgi:hypothetical protein